MKDKGRIPLWRQIEDDWKWKEPLHRSAWVWILVKAAWAPHNGLERGQLYFSVSWAPKLWGMSVMTASRFLRRLVSDGSISWQKGIGNKFLSTKTSNLTLSGNPCDTPQCDSAMILRDGVITVLKYNTYNTSKNTVILRDDTPSCFECGNHIEGKEKNKKEVLVESSDSTRAQKSANRNKSKPNPDVKLLIDFFYDEFLNKFKEKYVVQGVKDTAAVKRILGTLDTQEIKTRMTAYLKDEDAFIVKQGHGLAFFCSRINSYWNASATEKNQKKAATHLKLVEESETQHLQKIRDQIEALPDPERLNLYRQARNLIKKSPLRLDRIPGINPKEAEDQAIASAEIEIFCQKSPQK